MLSPIKTITLGIIAMALLTACGFEPMYGNTTSGSYGKIATEDQLAQVTINNIPNAEGQYLRNKLIDRFYRRGRPVKSAYSLSVAPLKETETNLDVTIESENTRAQLRIDTTIQLIDNATDTAVLKRDIRAFNSFNVLGSQFTTIVSEQDAREAALDDLARQIETQLILYFGQK